MSIFFLFNVLTLKNKNHVICLSILSVFYIYTIIYSLKIGFKPETFNRQDFKTQIMHFCDCE